MTKPSADTAKLAEIDLEHFDPADPIQSADVVDRAGALHLVIRQGEAEVFRRHIGRLAFDLSEAPADGSTLRFSVRVTNRAEIEDALERAIEAAAARGILPRAL